DTITAISTPVGEGAISIVRLSGNDAIVIADRLFSGKNLTQVDSHTIHYGKIIDPATNIAADEVMVTVMRSPKTFTCEDVIEINCHGGMIAASRILEMVLLAGARLAEPGEFTKRAFLNGRIDLSQAEELMEEKTAYVLEEINKLIEVAKQGKILREGFQTAIIGRPNVGKSSLMNTLVQEERAIVTDVPGTTRDIIEEYVNVRGIPLKLVDTAGIRETTDIVEKIGVDRSRQSLQEADLILFMLNYNEALTEEDYIIFDMIRDLNYIVIVNKTDLQPAIDMEE